jgi:dTDP-4-dehydrorhamnose 3,5-epimerase
MDALRLDIPDVLLITPRRFGDSRGFFGETYNRAHFANIGIEADFVQDNHSKSSERGTVRGLHFQAPPHAQDKLIRVCRGAIYDVAVDIRHGSPTYGQAVSAVLSAENWSQLWVPKGFAHGFCTLEPDTEVIYKVTALYSPDCDKGLAWDDPSLKIDWPVPSQDAVLSEKDRQHPRLAELPQYFHCAREAV